MSTLMEFLDNISLVSSELEQYWMDSVSRSTPVVDQLPIREIVERLDLRGHIERGGLSGAPLAEFVREYLSLSVRLAHPGSLAHQVAVPHPSAAVATLVEGLTNNPMAIYEMGPAAASIEVFLVEWLLSKVGWPTGAGGVLTHGGSLANLTALIAARSRFDPTIWGRGSAGDLAMITTGDSHYSVARAAGIMGVGEENLLSLPCGASGEGFATVMRGAREAGKRPFALIANACSTATGVFDPLGEIAELCREHGLWLHVDGAHGASVLLSETHRWRLDGIEMADSVSWDAHKLMRTPGLCTAVLMRDARALDTAFQQNASYLFHDKEQVGFDSIHRTVECTKASLGFRMFMVLAAMGEKGVADYIDRQFDLAKQAYELFRIMPKLSCAVEPQSNIVCFRVEGEDDLQLAVRDRLLAEGEFHLSTAVTGGRRYLRVVITSPETELTDLERLGVRVVALGNALRR
jgi:L-2,4-diaminobutyrate decarboxylase